MAAEEGAVDVGVEVLQYLFWWVIFHGHDGDVAGCVDEHAWEGCWKRCWVVNVMRDAFEGVGDRVGGGDVAFVGGDFALGECVRSGGSRFESKWAVWRSVLFLVSRKSLQGFGLYGLLRRERRG